MIVYTIGFTKKSARRFFETIKEHGVEMLIDIRLNNSSQLAGFSKGEDLQYFLKEICNCAYAHDMTFAPSKEIFDAYQSKSIPWDAFEREYAESMNRRNAVFRFASEYKVYGKICLLCSESTADFCHRRLLAELLQHSDENIGVIHL